ncbi:MAG TPA: DUF1002 domain-containing protein [Candidatus Merdenecus merdavium]|nr:DUF1002 domain-containing protein [Candidatus Merdenecus merdavium]
MKKKNLYRVLSILCTTVVLLGSGMSVKADRVDEELNKPFVSLGNDLRPEDRQVVLGLLGVTEEDLQQYEVDTVTNQEEHEYLGSFLSADVIGTKALSSVKVVGKEAGNGIKVTTQNITYCTTGMYQNALATAGIKDADITVVGPFNISGTAALVGTIKAYEAMTGEAVSKENLDIANNELVLTGEVAENVGDTEKAEQLMALVKEEVLENNITSKEDIQNVIDKAAKELDIQLSEEDQEQISTFMGKLDDLDLDVETIKNQAKDLYDKLGELDINLDTEKVGSFFTRIIDTIVEFFRNLFN